MITVHTSIMDSKLFDEELQRCFDFYDIEISLEAYDYEERTDRLKKLLTKLYRLQDNNFLAVTREREGRYCALVKKGQKVSFNEDDVCIKNRFHEQLPPNWVLLSLLINALPSQLASNPKYDRPWFFASDLHYVVGYKKYKNDLHEIICCKIKSVPCRGFIGHHLQPSSTTFSPDEAHVYEGRVVKRARGKPSFSLDNATQMIVKNAPFKNRSSYLNLPIYKDVKSHAPAFEISVKTPEKFHRSRLGILSEFLKDFNQVYEGIAKIDLRTFEAEQTKLNSRLIEHDYKKLTSILIDQPINIINSSDDELATEILANEFVQRGFSVSFNSIPQVGMNLHIIKSKDYYKSNDLPDPYQEMWARYPEAIIQSCTNDSIVKKNSHVIDVLITELVVKSEIVQRKLLADYPELPSDLIFMAPIKHPDKEKKAYIWCCTQIVERQLKLWEATEDEVIQVFSYATSTQLRRLNQTKLGVPYVIYDTRQDILFLLEDTQAISIPDHASLAELLKKIEISRQQLIPAVLVKKFLKEHEKGPELAEILEPLLDGALGGELEAEDVAKIHYKSIAKIAFHDYLAQHGYMLNTSLRGQHGPLAGVGNIWYVPDQGIYCAGSKDSPQQTTENFSHIYHLDHPGNDFPEWFIPSLQVWHIRHRNPTTIPFVFKHLLEFQKQQVLLRSLNSCSKVTPQ